MEVEEIIEEHRDTILVWDVIAGIFTYFLDPELNIEIVQRMKLSAESLYNSDQRYDINDKLVVSIKNKMYSLPEKTSRIALIRELKSEFSVYCLQTPTIIEKFEQICEELKVFEEFEDPDEQKQKEDEYLESKSEYDKIFYYSYRNTQDIDYKLKDLCRLFDIDYENENKYADLYQKYVNPKTEFKNRIKIPKLNEHNKPILTQKQISILFKTFKDKKIFNNRDIDKTDFSKIISELTGYSKNTIRQDLSASDNCDISVNHNDYDRIIEILNDVITDIEKQKKNIIK